MNVVLLTLQGWVERAVGVRVARPPSGCWPGPAASDGAEPARVLARAECEALFHKIVGLARGGETAVTIRLAAKEYLNWARNRPTMIGGDRSVRLMIARVQGSARAVTETNQLDDVALQAALAQAETRLQQQPTDPHAPPAAIPTCSAAWPRSRR